MSSRPSRGAARLAAILDALPDALLLVNRNGTVVNANAMALEALEAPGTPIVGRGLLDLLPTFDRSRIPGSVRAMDASDTRTKPTRMTARRTDGSLMPVEVTSANLPGAYDDELLMIVVRDLSGSMDVESELQRQQRQTEMILRAASEGIVGIDAEGSIVLVNPAAARILRHRASDLGGKSLHELLQPKKADGTPMPPDECPALVTLKTGRKQRLRDQVLWRGDGEALPVEMTTAPILLGEAVVGAVMTFTDTSRERTLAEHREQLAELLDAELLARIEASRARLKTLADGSIGELGPSARRVVRQVAGELEEMAGLTGEVLEHQRGEKKDGVERTAATVDDLLDRALETVTYPARAAGVEFTVTAAAVGVQVDVDAMTRALGHLIADTVGAGPKGSTVVVAAAQRGGKARIEVRGPASRGSSVHVPLARSVIEAHGGTVESHAVEGRGSTYVVELPADDEAAAKARPQDAAEEGKDVRARARKRARTSPAVRPGTAAAKPADKPGEKSGEDAGQKSEGGADGGTGGSDKNTPANDGGSAPRLPATRGDGGNANAEKDGSGGTGTGNGTGLEPADPAGPPPAATPPSLPAAAKPIALPAGESAAAPGTAPSVPLVPAAGGRRAARRALPSTEGPENAGNSGNAGNAGNAGSAGSSPGAMALPAGPSGGTDAGHAGNAGPRHGGTAEQGRAAHDRAEHGQPEAGQPDEGESGVPAKVNGRHTPHMARARQQMSTPPAAIPSQSRPGNPGAGSRSTSVQDRPERTGQPDLAPTELLDLPGLPQAPGPDADAPTALMPHIPFAPGEPSATPNPAANPTAPPPTPPVPPVQPPASGTAESGTDAPAPEAPRTPFTGRRRRALAPAQQPENQQGQPGQEGQPGQPGHELPSAAESEARGDGRTSGPYALPPAYGDAVAQQHPPQDSSGAMRAFGPPSGTHGHVHGRGHLQGRDQGTPMPFAGTRPGTGTGTGTGSGPGYGPGLAAGPGYGPGAPADGELGSALDLPQRTPGAAPHPGTVREPAQPDPHGHPGFPQHHAEPAGQPEQLSQPGHPSGSAHTAHQALQAAAAQLAPAQPTPMHSAPAPETAPPHLPHAAPPQTAPALPPGPGPAQLPQQSGPFPPHLPAGYDVDTPPPGELAAVDPNYPPMVAPTADGRPRRLLVWPSPDGPTSSALTARGWDPVLVRSREEVDASASAHPAALFVDPLTGPITRTALQSLRTAATAAHIPVLVTAGLMQATRDAAFGADPAVLLRSLAPADSAAHASRVLLVEANQDIATAFTGSLVRRGMDVVHVTSESEAVSKASSVEPNLVVLDLMLVRRRRLGIVDWLRNNQRLHSTPIVVYTTVDIAPEALPRLQTGETVLFLAERSTRDDVQQRVVDLLGKIASLV